MDKIRFLIGGSPCTFWSISQNKQNRETTATGQGWELFKNFLIAKEYFKPDFFLYENNKSAAQAIKDQISHELGVELQYINSALVSAQNRIRFYAHNFGDVPQPTDRGVFLKDILENGNSIYEPFCIAQRGRYTGKGGKVQQNFEPRFDGKTSTITTVQKDNMIGIPVTLSDREVDYLFRKEGRTDYGYIQYAHHEKSKCITANISRGVPYNVMFQEADGSLQPIYKVTDGKIEIKENLYPIKLPDGFYIIRKLTVEECCRLQTLPDDYCRTASKTQAYKGLGNGWTAEVIIHLLHHALKGIPKNTKIEVISMYDGIGTGRYCFDRLGYNNISYFAYEIDKHAMKIANSNYPDIIQKGDAFQIRDLMTKGA